MSLLFCVSLSISGTGSPILDVNIAESCNLSVISVRVMIFALHFFINALFCYLNLHTAQALKDKLWSTFMKRWSAKIIFLSLLSFLKIICKNIHSSQKVTQMGKTKDEIFLNLLFNGPSLKLCAWSSMPHERGWSENHT